ncbi:AEC family transporter [Haloferula rosea]|uniref:AEC family transporter n=1 Tax=Haloferula rosea TaxID=490093 RepID=A0A934RFF2_9BACT|nr:AEC family transporter [Haloferula rosea]MBK1827556.1 AEC family transporter [Haloferula rosea]
MEAAIEVLRQMLPVYLLIAVGAFLRRVGITKRENDDGILHLVFTVMYPCFIIDKILGNESVRDVSAVAWGIGLGFSIPVIGMALAWLVASLLRYEHGTGKRTFALTAGIQNFGYTAIPVVELMWAGSGALAMLFVHNLGVEIAIWSVGVMLISGRKEIPWRHLLNGPLVAVVLGLILVALNWDGMREAADGGEPVPGVLRRTMSWLGAGAFPVAIFTTGAVMMDLIGKERPSWRATLGGVGVRLALIPAVMLVMARFLPSPDELKQVLIVQSAMPAAMTPILLAKLYGGRPAVAVEIVVATTVVSMVTLPFVLLWGRVFVGF